jgi:hypothetical protein
MLIQETRLLRRISLCFQPQAKGSTQILQLQLQTPQYELLLGLGCARRKMKGVSLPLMLSCQCEARTGDIDACMDTTHANAGGRRLASGWIK